MFDNRAVCMLHQIMITEITITLLTHSVYVGGQHPVHTGSERIHGIAPAPEAETVGLGNLTHVAVRVGGRNNGHLVFQIRQQPRREVRNRETIVEKNQPDIA